MHICVIDLNGQFGPLNSLLDVVPSLTADGLTYSFIVPQSVHEEVAIRLDGHTVMVVDDRTTWRRERGIAQAVRALGKAGRRPDVIHANSTSAARGAILAGVLTRTPVLIHLRNSKLSTRERRFLQVTRWLPVRTTKVAVSSAAAAVAGEADGCRLIPDPVIGGPSRSARPAAQRPVVGVVANMQLTKGFDVFVDIAVHLADTPIDFEVFGSVGLEPITSEFVRTQRARLEALALSSTITFRGIVPDLREWMPQFDAMLITSRRESFSRVAVEAMLAEVPLVAPDIPGLSDTIGHGRFARTFAVGDAEAASRQLLDLFQHYDESLAIARAARQWSTSNYAPEVIAPQLNSVYSSLAGRRSRRGHPDDVAGV